jgi:NAD(P)-dependent dehydrogenase (short-subunit alcohol dehydrogenase family)
MKMDARKLSLFVLAGAGSALAVALARRARRGRRMDFQGASVVITGSRGLGLELARRFGSEGASVSLVARDEMVLKRALRELRSQGVDVTIHACDITRKDQVERTVRDIISEHGRIDVLVNNAGVVQVAPFENLDQEDFQDSLDIHAWGPLALIREIVPYMKRQGGGRIVNISSIGGLVAIPHLLAYCMGKFALTALSDGLRAELAKDGIRVTTVAPGLMRTGSHLNAYFKGDNRKEFAWFSIADAFPLFSISSARAARKIVEACRYGSSRLILSFPATLLHACNALLPGLLSAGSRLAVRLLPAPVAQKDNRLRTGRQSRSVFSPALLTGLADRAARRNNEL